MYNTARACVSHTGLVVGVLLRAVQVDGAGTNHGVGAQVLVLDVDEDLEPAAGHPVLHHPLERFVPRRALVAVLDHLKSVHHVEVESSQAQ